MTPLLERFVLESRDLLQVAATALLVLEKNPSDDASINAVFRAVHTIKGSSGLFDIAPLTRLVHVGEDLLGQIRTGEVQVTSELVDQLLESLDCIAEWIIYLSHHSVLPAEALEDSQKEVARLRALSPSASNEAPAPSQVSGSEENFDLSWLSLLPEAELTAAVEIASSGRAMTAIRYSPIAECFFSGEDPFNLFRQVPELIALHTEIKEPWAGKDAFDPYVCNFNFYALSSASEAGEPQNCFRYVQDQVRFTKIDLKDLLDAQGKKNGDGRLIDIANTQPKPKASNLLAEILASQMRILSLPADAKQKRSRLISVGATAQNLARSVGRIDLLDKLAAASDANEPEELASILTAWHSSPISGGAPKESTPANKSAPEVHYDTGVSGEIAGRKMLKVDQSNVDNLMNLIGELLVWKNSLPFLAKRAEEVFQVRELSRELKDQYAIIDRLSQEMQTSIMRVRMLPVSEVFERFPRLVRDLARKLNKRVTLETQGEETAADKTIIECLGDPLIHIVRNSIDHGIETPDVRKAAGKPETGTIKLKASQEADQIIIEVSDDGSGIHPQKIKASAIAKGIVSAEQAERLSDQDAVNLIFHAGFSTAAQISDVSGRGVGMDVVASTVDSLGGQVTVSSRAGLGTTIRLSLPLSMAVTRVMIVEACGGLYGIPMDMIVETVRVPLASITTIKQSETYVLRDKVVPLVRMSHLLGVTAPKIETGEDNAVLVCRIGGTLFGLVVDSFREGTDVILKPLDGVLSGLRCYSGSALMGDGRILLVLNLKELL